MQDSVDPMGDPYVAWMREASPYIHAHRGQIFVIYVGGDIVAGARCAHLAQDLALLCGVGVRLVVVHGARPQIEQRLADHSIESRYIGVRRVTDATVLSHVIGAVGAARVEIESKLSAGNLHRPSVANRLRVAGGNFIIARPAGIVDGVDLCFTGVVRRIDVDALRARLGAGELVLVSPLGYSPTGEVFNLSGLELATEIACELRAAKLITLIDSDGLVDETGAVLLQLTAHQARRLDAAAQATALTGRALVCARRACAAGVGRVHLINQDADGALLAELFTRDGAGSLLSNAPFDQMRGATIDDIGGVLGLIEPFEEQGVLVKRSREKLEMEIERFMVSIREDTVVACGALYPFDGCDAGEIACIAVHPNYHKQGFGDALLEALEHLAVEKGIVRAFVLTTQASHWFQERGYAAAAFAELPVVRQSLYNYQRNSAILVKSLT